MTKPMTRLYSKKDGSSELTFLGVFPDRTTAGNWAYSNVPTWPKSAEVLLVTVGYIYHLVDVPDGYSWEEILALAGYEPTVDCP